MELCKWCLLFIRAEEGKGEKNNTARNPLLGGAPNSAGDDTLNDRIARAVEDSNSQYLKPLTCQAHGSREGTPEGECTHTFEDVYTLKDTIGKGSTSRYCLFNKKTKFSNFLKNKKKVVTNVFINNLETYWQ